MFSLDLLKTYTSLPVDPQTERPAQSEKTQQSNNVLTAHPINSQEIRAQKFSFETDVDETKKIIFDSLKSRELKTLQLHLGGLDPLQKSKYFSSTMKFRTSWARGDEEMTPLQYACFLGNFDGARLLIDLGASVNDFGKTSDSSERSSLHFAVDGSHFAIAMLLLSKGAKDRLAFCDTMHAFKNYQLPELGSSLKCVSTLHMAIIRNAHELVEALLRSGGADIKMNTGGANSPLHLAARGGDEKMVKLLLSLGAKTSINLKNADDKIPKEVAEFNNHYHLLAMLS